MPDGVCNPVRNVLEWKRYGRGCKPRPAQIFLFQNQLFVLNLMALNCRVGNVFLLPTSPDLKKG
jgi:hypothetical protein